MATFSVYPAGVEALFTNSLASLSFRAVATDESIGFSTASRTLGDVNVTPTNSVALTNVQTVLERREGYVALTCDRINIPGPLDAIRTVFVYVGDSTLLAHVPVAAKTIPSGRFLNIDTSPYVFRTGYATVVSQPIHDETGLATPINVLEPSPGVVGFGLMAFDEDGRADVTNQSLGLQSNVFNDVTLESLGAYSVPAIGAINFDSNAATLTPRNIAATEVVTTGFPGNDFLSSTGNIIIDNV